MKKYKVYKITCLVNNKVYIGQTYLSLERRFASHVSSSKSKDIKFYRAMQKYGSENFKIELLEDCDSQEELDNLEYKWICYYNSCEEGYNTKNSIGKCGGDTLTNHPDLENIKKKLSISKNGISNPHHVAVKALNIRTNEELFFQTMKEAQDYFNLPDHTAISKRCRGITKVVWNDWTFAYCDNEYDYTLSVKKSNSKRVRVTDTLTEEIKEFDTLADADKYYNFPKKAISTKLNSKNPNTLYKDRYLFQFL